MVTATPGAPDVGDRLEIVGVGSTVKARPLLTWPATVTVALPVVAPDGTGAVMLVADQVVGVAVVVLNRIVLVPCVAPKFVPLTVTSCPTPPEPGDSGATSVGGGRIAGISTREL